MSNFLRDPAKYGTNYKPGRARSLDDRGRRRLFDETRKIGISARKLQSSLQLPASVRTTQRELQQTDLLEYVKRNRTPVLTPAHRNKRVDWGKKMLECGTVWGEVIFSNEKKFKLDGSDGLQKVPLLEEVFHKRKRRLPQRFDILCGVLSSLQNDDAALAAV